MTTYICDGHQYRVIDDSPREGFDLFTVKNNYGTPVATLSRTVNEDYWSVHVLAAELSGQGPIARIHEDSMPDNCLDRAAIQAYVAWAEGRDTVENH